MLQTYPKCKTEDGQAELFHRGVGKRRASHQSSEHDIEEQITEWTNMTWFLLALGGVCLIKRRQQVVAAQAATQAGHGLANHGPFHQYSQSFGSFQQPLGHLHPMSQGSISSLAQNSLHSLSSSSSSGRGSLNTNSISLATIPQGPQQESQYCPVTQYVLLSCASKQKKKHSCLCSFPDLWANS